MFKLISVNIEHDKHIDLVLKFLDEEKPDVLYLQEVFNEDYMMIKDRFSMEGFFESYVLVGSYTGDGILHDSGCALLSKFPLQDIKIEYYYGDADVMPVAGSIPSDEYPKVLLSAKAEINGKKYDLATTQFTWTKDGEATDRQRENAEKLLTLLKSHKSLILAGDFNAPRGREIFAEFNKHYRDNIPKEYTTSIDKNIHRAGGLQLMVDSLFSTEDIEFENVKLVDGVSDHMAIVAEVK